MLDTYLKMKVEEFNKNPIDTIYGWILGLIAVTAIYFYPTYTIFVYMFKNKIYYYDIFEISRSIDSFSITTCVILLLSSAATFYSLPITMHTYIEQKKNGETKYNNIILCLKKHGILILANILVLSIFITIALLSYNGDIAEFFNYFALIMLFLCFSMLPFCIYHRPHRWQYFLIVFVILIYIIPPNQNRSIFFSAMRNYGIADSPVLIEDKSDKTRINGILIFRAPKQLFIKEYNTDDIKIIPYSDNIILTYPNDKASGKHVRKTEISINTQNSSSN